MITNDDYSYAEHESITDRWVVHLKTGPYKDTYVVYGSVKIVESEYGEEPTLKFLYDVIDTPTYLDEADLVQDEEFMNHIGDILTHILNSAFESGDYRLGDKDEPRNNDTKELID